MPKLVDLVGQRVGRLLVTGSSGHGKAKMASVRCDCGAEEQYPQRRLSQDRPARPAVRACRQCRAPGCSQCGQPVPARRGRTTTCGDACARAAKRAIGLSCYYRKAAAEPGLNQRRHAAVRKRAEQDAEFAAHSKRMAALAQERRKARIASDPEYRERVLARARAAYARNAEMVLERRRRRLAALDPAARHAWLERVRAYGRAYRTRWRDELAADPERHRAFLDLMKEYKRQRRLVALLADGALLERAA